MISLPPHWIVNGQAYYNQLSAWQAIKATGGDGRFYFNEVAYDQHDWSQDPAESWDSLVHARCLQLRQRYTRLKLYYSAGRDSYHVLKSFARYNIPVDELIILYYPLNPMRNKEYYQWILPMAQEYKKINPLVKITTVEIDDAAYNSYYAEDWAERSSDAHAVFGLFQPTDHGWIANRYNLDTESGTGVIVGVDKPKIYLKDGKIYSTVYDNIFIFYLSAMRTQKNLECFYFTNDMPELHIKQCHMLVDYLRSHYPTADQEFIHQFVDRPSSPYYDEYCISTGRGPAANINVAAQNGKNKFPPGHIANLMIKKIAKNDSWVALDHYREAVEWTRSKFNDIFTIEDKRYNNDGLKTITGKSYYICDWPPKS